jgi:hypothetical protein
LLDSIIFFIHRVFLSYREHHHQAKLNCRIKHALIALYEAEQHLPSDEPEDSKLKVEFRSQIERLRSKLQQIAGVQALTDFDENRASGRAVAPMPGGVGAYSALPGRLTNEQLAHELLLDPEFQLNESGGCNIENPIYHRIRESFHQVMSDFEVFLFIYFLIHREG